MTGPRSYTAKTDDAPDYVSGWSFLTVSNALYAVMKDDPRFPYTIADLKALVASGKATYSPGHDDTGYFLEKFMGRASNRVPSGIPELNFPQNLYDMRLADTYLLEAEALVRAGQGSGAGSRAYALLNAVRDRVGLGPIPATIDNIFLERRKELAGEGHRFFDLIRTKQA
ncbi:RagB/SusD family nutrient uptake outer membrane protein, partial [Chitinophaga sp.]|uniref:RagB/SusD family nutrient uptake outer membrane protein n=1 Tax=Chitinophaga sp. TaxID=1869181 RepID=UPI002FDCC0A4